MNIAALYFYAIGALVGFGAIAAHLLRHKDTPVLKGVAAILLVPLWPLVAFVYCGWQLYELNAPKVARS